MNSRPRVAGQPLQLDGVGGGDGDRPLDREVAAGLEGEAAVTRMGRVRRRDDDEADVGVRDDGLGGGHGAAAPPLRELGRPRAAPDRDKPRVRHMPCERRGVGLRLEPGPDDPDADR